MQAAKQRRRAKPIVTLSNAKGSILFYVFHSQISSHTERKRWEEESLMNEWASMWGVVRTQQLPILSWGWRGPNKFVIMICTIMHAVQGNSEKQGSGGLGFGGKVGNSGKQCLLIWFCCMQSICHACVMAPFSDFLIPMLMHCPSCISIPQCTTISG